MTMLPIDSVELFISKGLFAQVMNMKGSGVHVGTDQVNVEGKFNIISGKMITIMIIDFNDRIWGAYSHELWKVLYESTDFDKVVKFVLGYFFET